MEVEEQIARARLRLQALDREDSRYVTAKQLVGDAERALKLAERRVREARAAIDARAEDPERLTLGSRIIRGS